MEDLAHMINYQRDLTLHYYLYLIYNNEIDKFSKFQFAHITKDKETIQDYCVSTKFFDISNALIEKLKDEQFIVFRSLYNYNQVRIHPRDPSSNTFIWKDLESKGEYKLENGFLKGKKAGLIPDFANCAFHV